MPEYVLAGIPVLVVRPSARAAYGPRTFEDQQATSTTPDLRQPLRQGRHETKVPKRVRAFPSG